MEQAPDLSIVKQEKPSGSKSRKDSSSSGRERRDSERAMIDELTEIEKKMYNMMKSSPKGISDKILQNEIPDLNVNDRASAINKLLDCDLIELYKQGNEFLYKLKVISTDPDQIKHADNEEKIVFSHIKESGNKGIWTRDIRFKSNLTMTHLTKILKSLENKKLIKAVKSVNASKKKVYMLYDIEPDRSLTGGAWYSDQDFESEFVSVLNQQCLRFITERQEKALEKLEQIGPKAMRMQAMTPLEDIHKYISDIKLAKVALSMEDIESILQTLVYDGKIRSENNGGKKCYTLIEPFIDPPGFVCTPCGVCPVFSDCSQIGPINPPTCTYLSDWIKGTPPPNTNTEVGLVPSKPRTLSGSTS